MLLPMDVILVMNEPTPIFYFYLFYFIFNMAIYISDYMTFEVDWCLRGWKVKQVKEKQAAYLFLKALVPGTNSIINWLN